MYKTSYLHCFHHLSLFITTVIKIGPPTGLSLSFSNERGHDKLHGEKGLGADESGRPNSGKNVNVSEEPRLKMIKPREPELGRWKVNQCKQLRPRVQPMSDMLLEKYAWHWRNNVFQRLGHQMAEVPRT
jgi:hypothetical protein